MPHLKKCLNWLVCSIAMIFMTTAAFGESAHEVVLVYGTTTSTSPNDTKGYRFEYLIAPDSWQHARTDWLFNLSVSHYTTGNNQPDSTLNTYAAAPELRWYFLGKNTTLVPFLNLSVGATYLSTVQFGGRDLGIHFSFQDMAGLGLAYKQVYGMVEVIHYSNAHLASHNSGVTLPLMLAVGYRF